MLMKLLYVSKPYFEDECYRVRIHFRQFSKKWIMVERVHWHVLEQSKKTLEDWVEIKKNMALNYFKQYQPNRPLIKIT